MRVAFVALNYAPSRGGAQELVQHLAEGLVGRGHQVQVLTTDGLSHVGIIASESGSSITLKQPEEKSEILLRSDIELIRSNGISLMPEGLEKNITIPQMADLISFIKNWRYVEENVPYQE